MSFYFLDEVYLAASKARKKSRQVHGLFPRRLSTLLKRKNVSEINYKLFYSFFFFSCFKSGEINHIKKIKIKQIKINNVISITVYSNKTCLQHGFLPIYIYIYIILKLAIIITLKCIFNLYFSLNMHNFIKTL